MVLCEPLGELRERERAAETNPISESPAIVRPGLAGCAVYSPCLVGLLLLLLLLT